MDNFSASLDCNALSNTELSLIPSEATGDGAVSNQELAALAIKQQVKVSIDSDMGFDSAEFFDIQVPALGYRRIYDNNPLFCCIETILRARSIEAEKLREKRLISLEESEKKQTIAGRLRCFFKGH
jgi:hypothetical protein